MIHGTSYGGLKSDSRKFLGKPASDSIIFCLFTTSTSERHMIESYQGGGKSLPQQQNVHDHIRLPRLTGQIL